MITKEFILENKDLWEKYKKEINELDSETLRDLILEEPDIINIIDLDKLNGKDIYNILRFQPDLIKDLKPYLDKLDGWDISHILIGQPKLLPYFKPYLEKLDGWQISRILMDHPGLIKDLRLYLHKLTSWPIFWVLKYHLDLIKDLKPYLHKIDKNNISNILDYRPELSLVFKYVGTQYQDAAYYCTFPSEISKLDEEEKQELSKKIVELFKKEKR